MKDYNGFSAAQRRRALAWVKKQVSAGLRDKQPTGACDACGGHAGACSRHSEDYSEPFGAHIGRFVLCGACHLMIHVRHRHADVWREYVDKVGRGEQSGRRVVWRDVEQVLYNGVSLTEAFQMFPAAAAQPSPTLLERIARGEFNPNSPNWDRSRPTVNPLSLF